METEEKPSVIRILWVADNLTTGGIGAVCRCAAEAVARHPGWCATVVSLRPPPSDQTEPATGVRYVTLGLLKHAPRAFVNWLKENPQQFVITNDVRQIESAFPYFPRETLHIVGMHDNSRRHIDVALNNHRWVDGVACVAIHIEESLRTRLNKLNFNGLLETVHNGAAFPPMPIRASNSGPLRLLFMGSVDPFKGIYDLVPILQRVKTLGVPVTLKIVGGRHDLLSRRFKQQHLESLVTWSGWVPHEDCFRIAEQSDLLLMPSRKEAFGMVTIEAMAMGCVPLAYDIPSGSREIIEHGRSGLLLPLGNFEACARAVKSLHENREELRRLSEGAMVRAREQFNSNIMAARLCAFLKRVQVQARICPSERKPGLPARTESIPNARRSRYQHLPASARIWLRNRIGACPRLCYWILSHW